jgi:uncharacterized protein YqeY
MSIIAQVNDDIKDAMRAKDTLKLGVVRMLKAAFITESVSPQFAGKELTDADAISVIRKQIKGRQDSAEQFTKNNRPELAEKELAEIKVLETYLPAGLSADELKAEVARAITDSGQSGPSAMGAVMKLLKERIGDRVDGKSLSAEVKAQLG